MFSQEKRNRSQNENSIEQSKIAHGSKFVGDIEAQGDFRIDGLVEGNIMTPGRVVIGKDGAIHGTLQCQQADIEGRIKGKLLVSDLLSLRATAYIGGEVEVGKLAVEPGATFNASCSMNNGVKEMKKENEKRSA